MARSFGPLGCGPPERGYSALAVVTELTENKTEATV